MYNLQKGHTLILINNKQALWYGTRTRYGDGLFKHLGGDCDLKYWATKFEQELLWIHNILVTYKHVYSHQEAPAKLMQITPALSWAEAKQHKIQAYTQSST